MAFPVLRLCACISFYRVDTNQDKRLSINELEKWIASKVKEHYAQAVRDNFWIFSALDKNHDGKCTRLKMYSCMALFNLNEVV